jgi:hypothetical protein
VFPPQGEGHFVSIKPGFGFVCAARDLGDLPALLLVTGIHGSPRILAVPQGGFELCH